MSAITSKSKANSQLTENDENLICYLDWCHKQSRILSCNNSANSFYTAERGYQFHESELPHHNLLSKTTHSAFSDWIKKRSHKNSNSILCGAWKRTLFVGGWEHSTSKDETVFNIQTNSLFIDLRIPKAKPKSWRDGKRAITDLTDLELRMFARQHVFGGFGLLSYEKGRPVCVRHHCMDWNFVGTPRQRPNKWFVEMRKDGNAWKEWSYANDHYGQGYYWEKWERLEQRGSKDISSPLVLAMRKSENCSRDGILVVVGDHFNFMFDRFFSNNENKYPAQNNLVDLIDDAIANGDRSTAESYLTIQAGHGRVNNGWVIDCAIQSWQEGQTLFQDNNVMVKGGSADDLCVIWNDEKWDVLECSLKENSELECLLKTGKIPYERTSRL